jgi:hypothetical protein
MFYCKIMQGVKTYSMRFIQPGLCGYVSEGDGVVLIQKPALDSMAKSFKGMPIFNEQHHQTLTKEELIRAFRTDSVGVVANASWNPDTGWYDGEIIIWDEAAAKNIESGEYFPSCAYIPSENGIKDGGGVWHNVDYDLEILDGEYTHLAIVKNPRYEDAKFFENSKGENRMRIFNLLSSKKDEKKNEAPPPAEDDKQKPPEEKQNDTVNPDDVVDVGGTQVKLGDLIANYKKQKPAGGTDAQKENALALDDQVEIAPGVIVQISELVQAWTEKENSIPPQDTTANPVVQEKQNSKDKPEVNQELKNSIGKGGVIVPEIETAETRIKIGNARYSLKEVK